MEEILGAVHFVLLLGGVNIEIAVWKAVGNWPAASGWTDIIENADSFLRVSHVKRTRQADNKTAATRTVLHHGAYMH